ncbi:ornithine carbamoyltransferase [Pelosinus baikalensis]|uniref:Ornithine carbamoyltransferase n=2 Tax=Pelosinus TaxID=365348 RepID=I8TM50_9FIRM|nr:Ornithine carbamoyltransferase [Pelosinus fermentans JBW45]MCC5466688.1 ornithine carbamoyltransferase [Pelosinus baikalensis]
MGIEVKDLLSIHDLSTKEINDILDLAKTLKTQLKNGEQHHLLKGKTLGMIFQKASTRTRVSFEVGMWQLGGAALFLNANDMQIGRGEPVKDTARVLSRYVDGIMIRTFSHDEVIELAQFATIPVINALTDLMHPCQALTDIFTVLEHKGRLQGLKMVYIGDGNNMVNSLLQACAKVGMDISIATPKGYEPDAAIVAEALTVAAETGSKIVLCEDPLEAAKDADVLYTDVWASMGKEIEQEDRREVFVNYQINQNVMNVAKKDAIVLHCLPAHRGEEITEEVLESKQSVVFDQAENRLHVQKAIMVLLMGK